MHGDGPNTSGVHKALHAAGSAKELAEMLRPGGRLASLLGATTDQAGRDDITVASVVARSTADTLAGLLEQVADGRPRVHISGHFPLDRAEKALQEFGRGKVLITA